MIMNYLLMSYIALVSCWPVTLILLSVAVVVLLHAERRVLNVSIVVLVGFLVYAAWQFGETMRSPSSLLVGRSKLCTSCRERKSLTLFQFQPSISDPFRNYANLHSFFSQLINQFSFWSRMNLLFHILQYKQS